VNTRGRIFAVEGEDGSGKTTVAALVSRILSERGVRVVLLRDPGSTPLGEKIRPLLLDPNLPIDPCSLLFLYAATSNALLVEAEHRLREGADAVLLDRCYLSSLPYRFADGIETDVVMQVAELANIVLSEQNIFYLDVPAEVRQERLRLRGGSGVDRFEGKPAEWQQRLTAGYDWCLAHGLATPVDGNRPIEEVADDLVERIWKRKG
jgi:dTMP kinase